MLSRPLRDQSSCLDMLAAKACSPGRDSILLPRGTHAFAAGRARAITFFQRAAKAWHPPDMPKVARSVALLPPFLLVPLTILVAGALLAARRR